MHHRGFSLLLLIIQCFSWTCSEISMDYQGGYRNIKVGLSADISEMKIKSLMEKLEDLFQNASRLLRSATKDQTYFREIVIFVPKKYKSFLSDIDWSSGLEAVHEPDVMVTSGDAILNPYTLQVDGCGREGLRINVPEEFVFRNKNSKDRELIQEWSKMRYGIFDESGFPGDELYPSCYTFPGKDEIKVIDCTNSKALYDIRKNENDICSVTTEPRQNEHITSSLMTKSDFSQAVHFCDNDRYLHDEFVPSKHNNLCRQQSTWDVIAQHQDFQTKKIRDPLTSIEKLAFKYVTEPEFRLVMAVDTSTNMAINDRLDMLRNAFSYFVLYNLPEESTIGLKDMRNEANSPLLVAIKTQADAERLIDIFPELAGEDSVCVLCGIEQGLKALKTPEGISEGHLIVASSRDIDKNSAEALLPDLRNNHVILHVIYFQKRLKEKPLLHKLAEKTGGHFFYVPENFGGQDSVSSLTLLYEVFRSIYESNSWLNRHHVLVDQKTFWNDSCTACSLQFSSDGTMENFQVLLTGPAFIFGPPVIRDKITLSNGNQVFAPGHFSFSYKSKIPAYMFSIRNPKPGQWHLNFERKPGFQKPLVVIIRSTREKSKSLISMSAWIRNFKYSPDKFQDLPPLKLYSEVKNGQQPVADVSVTASFYSTDSGRKIDMKMFDTGDGSTDIVMNDGIFSRYYMKDITGGYYILTFTAESESVLIENTQYADGGKAEHCCGGSYPKELVYKSGPFKRVLTLPSFYLDPMVIEDRFAPRRISDFRVDEVIPARRNNVQYYVFKWTAPGNNYDSGTAFDYQLRVFSKFDDAVDKFETSFVLNINEWYTHGPMLNPHEAGSEEKITIQLKNITTGTYYAAIRAINLSGKRGDISNIIELYFTEPSPTIIDDTTLFPENGTRSIVSDRQEVLAYEVKLAIGLSFGILIILIVIGFAVYCLSCRYRNKKTAPPPAPLKTESNDPLCTTTEISVISPVSSWPADSLLSHYESLKRHRDSQAHSNIVDTMSTASTKYSYDNKLNPASLYDTFYYDNNETDNINYPFNPSYSAFNPPYVSSANRIPENSPFGSRMMSMYDTTFERGSHRLKTDV